MKPNVFPSHKFIANDRNNHFYSNQQADYFSFTPGAGHGRDKSISDNGNKSPGGKQFSIIPFRGRMRRVAGTAAPIRLMNSAKYPIYIIAISFMIDSDRECGSPLASLSLPIPPGSTARVR